MLTLKLLLPILKCTHHTITVFTQYISYSIPTSTVMFKLYVCFQLQVLMRIVPINSQEVTTTPYHHTEGTRLVCQKRECKVYIDEEVAALENELDK